MVSSYAAPSRCRTTLLWPAAPVCLCRQSNSAHADGQVRLSIDIEDADDLIANLEQALAQS